MGNQATEAVLIHAGRAVARAVTTAKAGETVSYGFREVKGVIHEVGRAKVSRAAKYLRDAELMAFLETRTALVNYGGGAPI